MGNLLCIPKTSKKEGSRKPKNKSGIRSWFSRNKNVVSVTQDAFTVASRTSVNVQDEVQPDNTESGRNTATAVQDERIIIAPVVSSSILLRHFDDESDDFYAEPTNETRVDPGAVRKVADKRPTSEYEVTMETLVDSDTERNDADSTGESSSDTHNNMGTSAYNTDSGVGSAVEGTQLCKDEFKSLNKEKVNDELKAESKNVLPRIVHVKPVDPSGGEDKNDGTGSEVETRSVIQNTKDTVIRPVDSPRSDDIASTAAPQTIEVDVSPDVVNVEKAPHTIAKQVVKEEVAKPKVVTGKIVQVKPVEPLDVARDCELGEARRNVAKKSTYDKEVLTAKPQINLDVTCVNTKVELIKELPDTAGLETAESVSKPVANSNTETAKRATASCPKVSNKLDAVRMLEHTKSLGALSAMNVSGRTDAQKFVKPPETPPPWNVSTPQPGTSSERPLRNVFGPRPGTNESNGGNYQSRDQIRKWLNKSVSAPTTSVTLTTVDDGGDTPVPPRKVVSDFEIPKRAPRKPPQPLVLKKPSPHLFGIPGVAQSDLTESRSITWTQKNVSGPHTDVMWTTKPTSYDVRFPPLPKRLLAREGSVGRLRSCWVLPQLKQIETLKREYGRYPGLIVPPSQRGKYSTELKLPQDESDDEDTYDDDDDDDDEDGDTDDGNYSTDGDADGDEDSASPRK